MIKHIVVLSIFGLPTFALSTCDEAQFSCRTPAGDYGACINKTCSVIQAEERIQLQFSVVVRYPESTLQKNKGKELYMRGNALGFTWQKGIKLNKTGLDTWRADLIFRSASDGFRCQFCTNNRSFTGDTFLYRLYIDDSVNMLGGNLEVKLPISESSPYFSNTPVFNAYPWFFSKNSTYSVFHIQSPEIGKTREIVIHKPPSFNENTYKRYPTLLVFDFEESVYSAAIEMLTSPIVDQGTVGEFIAVGFGDYQPKEERFQLLTQVDGEGFLYICKNGTLSDGCAGCIPNDTSLNFTGYFKLMLDTCGDHDAVVGKGNATLDFLINTVLPKAKEMTDMRMFTDQPNLGIMGYSLGGLMACHAAWTRPNIFGYAACQSPSFWWPGVNNFTECGFFFNNITLKDSSLRTSRPHQNIYLGAGGTETLSPWTLTQAMIAAAEDMQRTGYFEWNKNLWLDVFPTDLHSSTVWISRLWVPLKIFFPTKPGPVDEIATQICVSGSNPVFVG